MNGLQRFFYLVDPASAQVYNVLLFRSPLYPVKQGSTNCQLQTKSSLPHGLSSFIRTQPSIYYLLLLLHYYSRVE